jgi:hypothetical protein
MFSAARIPFLRVATMLIALGVTSGWAAPTTSIEVAADREYRDYPLTVEVNAPAEAKGVVVTAAGASLPAQLSRVGDKAAVTVILPALKKGQTVTLKTAFETAAPAAAKGVQVKEGKEGADVLINGQLFTRYLTSAEAGPKPYLYPVIGPTGEGVTRNYPMKDVAGEKRDHPHHRSFWFTHDIVALDKANPVQFWMEDPKKAGKELHAGFESVESGPAMGRFLARTNWVGPDGKKVCSDVRDIRVYNVPGGRLFDWNTTILATEGDVTFGDTKEGTFGCRVAQDMAVDSKKGGKIVNSRGQTDDKAWGMPAEWVDYTGPVGGKTVGIAMMNHPTSFRFPTTWHVRTYGLFAANPFGLRDFPNGKGKDGSHVIQKGGSMAFVYRMFIHEGDTKEADVASIFEQYATPPKVTVR